VYLRSSRDRFVSALAEINRSILPIHEISRPGMCLLIRFIIRYIKLRRVLYNEP
jgi:hypothetical protein